MDAATALHRRRPLRVALFSGNYNYTRDGANQALNRLASYLQASVGAEVRVYSPTSPTPAFEPVGELVSVPSVRIPGRGEYRLALGLTRAVREDVRRFRPDIVHLSAPDPLGQGALRFARSLGAPVVASLHTRFETYLDYYGLGAFRPLVERRLAAFYAACDYVLAPTVDAARALAATGSCARLWARGVDRALFDPIRRDPEWRRSLGFSDNDAVVLFFGRVVAEKGLDVFGEAVTRAAASRPSLKVLVVGEGPMRERFARQLPGAVFTGFLSGPDLARAVASADVLFHPSRTEAFGNVTLEAMAAGLAVVAADAPSNRHLVVDGETGALCDPDDVAGCAQVLGDLADAPMRRFLMGRAARAASAGHDWDATLARVLDVYREATGRAPAGAVAPSARVA